MASATEASAILTARMTETLRIRRIPAQARSRETVQRILDAAEAIVGEAGVDAATTRAIAERAAVAAPSLYRFFADRDEVLDAVLERGLLDLDAHAERAEQGWAGTSIEDFIQLELQLHVAYYEAHPSFVKLWFGGRVSPPVVDEVHARNRALAHRARDVLLAAGLVPSGTPEIAFDMLVELGDRVLEMAFDGSRKADRDIIETGAVALIAFLEQITRTAAGSWKRGRRTGGSPA